MRAKRKRKSDLPELYADLYRAAKAVAEAPDANERLRRVASSLLAQAIPLRADPRGGYQTSGLR